PVEGEAAFIVRWLQSPSPSIEMQLESPTLIYQDKSFKNIVLKVALSDLFNHLQGNIYSSIDQVIGKEFLINDLMLTTTINNQEKKWPIIFSAGDNSTDIATFYAEGYWFLNEKIFNLSINDLHGKIYDNSIALLQPIKLKLTPSSIEMTPLQFSLIDGIVNASIDYHAFILSSSLQFEHIPLKLLSENLTSIPLQGLISGSATINGPLNNPKAEGKLEFKNVKINDFDFADVHPISGSFQVNLDEKGVKCNGNAIIADRPPLHIEAQLPIALSLYPVALNVDKTAPISGAAQLSGEIQSILQLFSKDTISVSGPVNATVQVTGTMESPLINGTANITNGGFENLEIGTVLSNLSASFEGSGKEITLKELSATDKVGNKLTGTGQLLLDPIKKFPYQFDFSINNLALLDQDFVKGAFTGNLALKGNVAGATLTGTANATSLTVTIPEQTAAVTNSIDVTYINIPENEKTHAIEKSPSWPLILDINVATPDNVAVRGRDLTSEWKGNLALSGPATNPILSGSFKIIRGQYLFNGKNFDINQGSISLDGSLDNKSMTTLYVIASKDLGKVKVEVIVKGPVAKPEISFRSNPPLPQREILSWILFNRGTSEISPFQGTYLTESITNLKSSASKGPDVLTKIRNSLGIDRIDISRDENNENAVSIQVGKYISENIFISVNKSSVNRIALEATLFPNIKLQAQVGDDSEGQLLLKWKHDY
nr:translocation/assembly module TamB [Parachlamydiaceae bacterium]